MGVAMQPLAAAGVKSLPLHACGHGYQHQVAHCVLHAAGGQWQQLTEEEEVDMASPQTIKGFLQEGFNRCACLERKERSRHVALHVLCCAGLLVQLPWPAQAPAQHQPMPAGGSCTTQTCMHATQTA
jgi:hypothetical protein